MRVSQWSINGSCRSPFEVLWSKCRDSHCYLQKRTIRIIAKAKYNQHTNPLFRQFNVLKIHDLCALHDIKFCFKLKNNLLPQIFLIWIILISKLLPSLPHPSIKWSSFACCETWLRKKWHELQVPSNIEQYGYKFQRKNMNT